MSQPSFNWGFTRRGLIRLGLALAALLLMEIGVRVALHNVTTTAQRSWFSDRWIQSGAVQTNRFGFREREFTLTPTSAARICIIGDSFLFGQGLPVEDRLSNMLEKNLREQGSACEVLNFGRKGANLSDYIEILHRYVLSANPDYVVLQWFINDADSDAFPYPSSPGVLHWKQGDRFLMRHSVLWSLLGIALDRAMIQFGIRESYWNFTRNVLEDAQSDPAVAARDALHTFVGLCRRNGIEVAVVLFPDLGVDLSDSYPLGFLMDRTASQCVDLGVPCMDLRDVYGSLGKEQWSSLHVNWLDSHPSTFANRIAVDAICPWLMPLVKTCR